MARISDVPKVIRHTGLIGFGKKVWLELSNDEVFTWGSALAYAWIFAIFPFMIFLLTLAPYLPGGVKERVLKQVSDAAHNGMGDSGSIVVDSVHDVMTHQKGGLLSIGLILALWGASGGMAMTMSALDKAYYVHCNRSFIKQRLIAIGLTVAAAVLILAVLFLLPIGTAILDHLQLGTLGTILANVLRYALAVALLLTVVALIYFFGPCVKTKWQAVTPGAIFTVAVWIVLGFGFALYVKKFGNFNKTYGALGGAIILLLFFYINAVVLVIGAEVNSVIDFEALDVKPGATDLTQAKAKAEYDQTHAADQREDKPAAAGAAPAGSPGISGRAPAPARASAPPAPTHRGRNVLVASTSLLALKWGLGKWSAARAKERARARAMDEARRRWVQWAAS